MDKKLTGKGYLRANLFVQVPYFNGEQEDNYGSNRGGGQTDRQNRKINKYPPHALSGQLPNQIKAKQPHTAKRLKLW